MSKEVHIVAVEVKDPDFEGYKKCDPFTDIQADVWVGPRIVLEELDSAIHIRDGKVVLQTIPYILVEYEGKVLMYVRQTAGNEGRLHGNVSIGLGGHVDLDDVVSKNSIINLKETLSLSAARELEEEIGLQVDPARLEWTGLIMRRDRAVDRVHLGYVAKITLNKEERGNLKETRETGEFKFEEMNQIQATMPGYEFEAWTKAIIES